MPPSTYTGPINNSINNTPQGDALVRANQEQAAKMGIKIPGVSTPAPFDPFKPQPVVPPAATPPPTTPTSTTPTTTTPTPTTPALADQADRDALAQAQADYQAQGQKVMDTINNISNGITPLNPGEQAQVDSLKQQFQTMIDQQQITNTGASGVANVRGYQTGAAQYDPSFQARTIGAIVSAGVDKITGLQTKEAGAVSDLTNALRDNDIKAVQDAWNIYQDVSKSRQDALQKTITDTQAAIKDAQDAKIAADKVQYDTITKPIQDLAAAAAKNGASQDVINAINAAQTVNDALAAAGDSVQTATGDLGDYLGYKRQATLAGHVPMNYDDWLKAKDDEDIRVTSAKAYATEAAKSAFTESDANQQKLEQQYRSVLVKELSNRTGGLGMQDQKVNQAIHLRALYDQYYDPKTGNYNVPQAQYGELILGLANLLSASGTTSEADRAELRSKTAVGDIKGALQYITGVPQNGNSQQIIKNLVDSINRQGAVAEQERNTDIEFLHGLVPTDLSPDRVDALEQNTLNSFVNPTNDPLIQNGVESKKGVDDFISQNPGAADTIANLYDVQGATDADVLEYIGMHPELAQ